MADRSISVHLRAITDSYRREMDKAAEATQRLTDRAGGLENIGGQMQRVGGMLTRSVTLPLAAAGAASVKFSNDFEKSFATMVGLAGVAAEDVDGLKQSVLELAGETARAPQELADALYFAASAGLDTQQAMEAVELSAKAAAAGMGRTEEVVGLVASAIASYGKEAITAAEATDILTATVREGRADPEELASTLGRVLPIAAQLGVEFDEVGGTVAYLSNVFGDTNRTVTATQGLLVKLVSPSKQGRKALEEMGTSIEEVHAAIDEDGLLGALELLREKGFAGNEQALRSLFDDIEGYQAALALLNDRSGTLTQTMEGVSDSAGALDNAFGAMAETAGFANSQAFAQLQVALIQIGDTLAPLVADIAQFAATLLGLFSDLPGPAQKAVIAFGGLLAAVGPLASIGGKIASNWSTLGRVFDSVAEGAYGAAGAGGKLMRSLGPAGMAGALTGVGALLTTGVVLYQDYANTKAEAARITDRLVDALQSENAELETNAALADELALKDYAGDIRDAEVSFADLTAAVREHGDAIERLDDDLPAIAHGYLSIEDALERAGLRGTAFGDALTTLQGVMSAGDFADLINDLDGLADAHDTASGTAANLAAAEGDLDTATKTWHDRIREGQGVTGGFADELGEVEDAAAEAVDPLEELEKTIDAVTKAYMRQIDPFFAAEDAMLSHRDAQQEVTDAALDVMAAAEAAAEAEREHGEASDEAAKAAADLARAEANLESAERKVVRSAMDVATAQYSLKRMMEEGNLTIDGAVRMLRSWVDQGLLTEQQADQAAASLGLVAWNAGLADSKNVEIPVNLSGYERTILQLMALDDLANHVGARTSFQYRAGIDGRAGGGPVSASTPYIVGERGPELMVPGMSGSVIPSHVLEAIRSGNPTGANVTTTSSSVTDARVVNVVANYPKPERASVDMVSLGRKAALALA